MMSDFWVVQKAGVRLAAGVVRMSGKALRGAVRLGQRSAANARELMVDVER